MMNLHKNVTFGLIMGVLLIGIFVSAEGEFGGFNSLDLYCSDAAAYSGASVECAKTYLKTQDFSTLDSRVFDDKTISRAIISDEALLNKYAEQILDGKVKLKREGDFDDVMFNENGILSLPSDNNGFKTYDLTKIPEGTKVNIFEDRLEFEFNEDQDLSDLQGIASDSASFIDVKEGSKFKFNGQDFEVLEGNMQIGPSGNLYLPKDSTASLFGGDIVLTNNENSLLDLSVGSESLLDNSVSLVDENGLDKLVTKASSEGKYSLNFKDGRVATIGGNGGQTELEFKDIIVKKNGEELLKKYASLGMKGKDLFITREEDKYYHGLMDHETKRNVLLGETPAEMNLNEDLDLENPRVNFGVEDNDEVIYESPDVKVGPVSFSSDTEERVGEIRTAMADFSYDVKSPFSKYKDDIPEEVKVLAKGDNGEILAGEADVSFYKPGEVAGTGGGKKVAVGPRINDLLKKKIPVVAGSERLGVPFGNALYELENPLNGKKTVVAVVDRFGEWTLENKPERFFDILSNSGVPEELGFEGNPNVPDSYGVKKVRFRYIGPIDG